MRSAARPTVILAVAFWLSGVGTPAHAGSLNPNPATTTPIPAGYTNISAGNPTYVVTATPNPAVFIPNANCPWLLPALAAEGFAQADPNNPRGYTGANGWTINFAELSGSFTRQVWHDG